MNWKKAAIFFCLALIASCGGSQQTPRTSPPGKTLVLGLAPERNLFRQVRRYEPIAEYLSRKTGIRIELRIFSRYEEVIDRFRSEGLDGGFFGSYSYVLAHKRWGIEPVARPVDLRGEASYRGFLFVRKGSGIRDVRGMRGKRLALVDNATTAGYLFPYAWFRRHGVAEPGAYLGEIYYAGTHEDAIRDVLDGAADVGAAKSTVFDAMVRENPGIAGNLLVIAGSEEVPETTLALDGRIDRSSAEKIRNAILAMHEDPEGEAILREFGAQRFIRTEDAEYRNVYGYAERSGAVGGFAAGR